MHFHGLTHCIITELCSRLDKVPYQAADKRGQVTWEPVIEL